MVLGIDGIQEEDNDRTWNNIEFSQFVKGDNEAK